MKFLDGRLLVWKAIKILFKNEKFRMMGGWENFSISSYSENRIKRGGENLMVWQTKVRVNYG